MNAILPANAEPEFIAGNQVELLETGGQFFPALIAAVDAAVHEVHLETYIFADDPTGRRVAAALGRAARRGVAVRVLVDGFGAREFAAGLGTLLAADGAEVMTYRPGVGGTRFGRHRLRRMHRKLAVADGAVAFVGGINVLDDFDNGKSAVARFDYAVRIEGPLVERIHTTVRHVWRLVRWAKLARRPPVPAPIPVVATAGGSMLGALLIRDNLRHRRDIENAYLDAIAGAQIRILISNAYFLPGGRFRKALQEAARRGVEVTLLLQGRADHVLMQYATRALYARLLSAGVRIFEYHQGFLHAKVATIDSDWATVGSSNIDPFSLLLAREANVVVRDAAFAGHLRRRLETAIDAAALEVRREDQRRRSWLQRLASVVAYGLVRLLVAYTGYGGSGKRQRQGA